MNPTQPTMMSLFPTPLYRVNIGREFTEAELHALSTMNDTPGKEEVHVLHDHIEPLCFIRKFIEDNIARYLNDVISPVDDI